MKIKPLNKKQKDYLTRHQLNKKFSKQAKFFQDNPRYPSLNTELLEPESERVYSFRIDRKYRTLFIFLTSEEIEIIDINVHYQ